MNMHAEKLCLSHRHASYTPGSQSYEHLNQSAEPRPCILDSGRSHRANQFAPCRGHAYWTQVGRTVRTSSHLIKFRQIGDSSQVRNATSVHNSGADVVDQLFLDELLAILDDVEYFADSKRCSRVAAN